MRGWWGDEGEDWGGRRGGKEGGEEWDGEVGALVGGAWMD